MSRVGKAPIKVAQGVKIEVKGDLVKIEGPKGKLQHRMPAGVTVKQDAGVLTVIQAPNSESGTALQGVTRSVLANMVHGVHEGFLRELDINGVGFRAAVKGRALTLTVGYSHPVEYTLPEGITASVTNNTHISLVGSDKVLVGMVAAKIRSFRAPEPYQGKGIKYTEERIVRKQGKAAGAK